MTYTPNAPVYPQHAPVPPNNRPRWWRKGWILGAAGIVLGLIIGVAAGGGATTKTRTVAGPTTTAHATVTATATVPGPTVTQKVTQRVTQKVTRTATRKVTVTPGAASSFSDGTYVVGTDIQAGVYKTNGQGSLGMCYWSRLASLNTSDINDNGIVTGPTTIQVQPSDKALEVSGGCSWSRIG